MMCEPLDGARSSPSLASIPSKVVRVADARSHQRQIVVVAEGQSSVPVVDPDQQRLSAIPPFAPLIRSAVSLSEDSLSSRPPQLDPRHVLALAARYQDHLHQCAEAVAFDQNALCVRIKEVLSLINNNTITREIFIVLSFTLQSHVQYGAKL